MPTIIVTRRNGIQQRVDGVLDSTLMVALRDSGVDEVLALCGGYCNCATCHVYVDAAFISEIPDASVGENGLLEISAHRLPTSRLACQIKVTDKLEGLRVTISPED